MKSLALVAPALMLTLFGGSPAVAGPILFNNFGAGDTFTEASSYAVDGFGFQGFRFVASASGALAQITVALGRTGPAQTTTWFDLYDGAITDAFGPLLESFAVSNSGVPNSTPPFTGAPVTFLSALMPTLTEGNGYWLSFREGEATNGARSVWFYNSTGSSGYRLTSAFISERSLLPAFRIEAQTASVPEPASLLLFGTGLVGLRAWRKRRP